MLVGFASVAARCRSEMWIVAGVGVGLHMGEVALGLVGPRGRQSMTMVGDTANVAARLCGRARAGELLMSSAIAAALKDDGRIVDPAGWREWQPARPLLAESVSQDLRYTAP
jgi:class 3 adenylate cyclase